MAIRLRCLDPLPSTRETQLELLVPGFGLAQPNVSQHFGSEPTDGSPLFYLSVYDTVTAFQVDENQFKK